MSGLNRRYLEGLFQGVRRTLLNRRLYRKRRGGGGIQEVAWKRALLLDDLGVVAFEVDVQRLPVRIEQLLDPDVTHQMQASLGGRRVWTTNTSGLCFCVKLEPEEPKSEARLPRRVPLDLNARPQGDYMIPVGLSQDGPTWRSLLDTGHILVGGETGSGKSTWLNAMLVSLLDIHTADELQIAIVDPKVVEFIAYRGVPHLFDTIATEVDEAEALLARVLFEMDRRMALFARVRAKNLKSYNERVEEQLPLLLLIIDEVTDIALQAGLNSQFYRDLIRLVSKGRAFGLIVVLATQNPKAEVLNTLIRGNLSSRIAFRVATAAHSRVILGCGGAQELPRTIRGRLLARMGDGLKTMQGFYIKDEAIEALIARLGSESVQILSDLEREMVRYAVEHLGGEFNTNKLWPQFREQMGRNESLLPLARRWELVGLLTPQPGANKARRVSPKLLELAGISDKG